MIKRLLATIERVISDNADLMALGWLLACAQTIVPLGHYFARADGAGWMTLAVSASAVLRGRSTGDGPHPMLVRRRASLDANLRRLSIILAPWNLLFLYDAARMIPSLLEAATAGKLLRSELVPQTASYLASAFVLTIVQVFLARVGRDDGATAWHPPGAKVLPWLFGAFACIVGSILAGLIGSDFIRSLSPMTAAIGPATLLGGQFLYASLVTGRTQDIHQRRAAGRRDDQPYQIPIFQPALILIGPSLGLWLLQGLLQLFDRQMSFSDAYVVAIHAVTWAGLIWPRRPPVAVQCLLHELAPTGGHDAVATEAAEGFERPPEGALRLNPLTLKSTRAIHPWIVPVRSSRIDKLDNPARPLWNRPNSPIPTHVMGEVAFEVDPVTGMDQVERITIRLRGQQETAALNAGNAQSRRVVVLRAYPKAGESRRHRLATYRWEKGVPAVCVQAVTSDTESLTLEDGSVLIISIEGYARAYEVEIGAPLYASPELETFRMPQIEDYAAAGG